MDRLGVLGPASRGSNPPIKHGDRRDIESSRFLLCLLALLSIRVYTSRALLHPAWTQDDVPTMQDFLYLPSHKNNPNVRSTVSVTEVEVEQDIPAARTVDIHCGVDAYRPLSQLYFPDAKARIVAPASLGMSTKISVGRFDPCIDDISHDIMSLRLDLSLSTLIRTTLPATAKVLLMRAEWGSISG